MLALLLLLGCSRRAPVDTVADARTAVDSGAACASDADCRLFDDYCTGCNCRPLRVSDRDPVCAGPGVRCFAQACLNKVAACERGACVVRAKPAP
jgi:hypothetical protein